MRTEVRCKLNGSAPTPPRENDKLFEPFIVSHFNRSIPQQSIESYDDVHGVGKFGEQNDDRNLEEKQNKEEEEKEILK